MAAAAQPGVLHVTLERAFDLKDMDLVHKMVRCALACCLAGMQVLSYLAVPSHFINQAAGRAWRLSPA